MRKRTPFRILDQRQHRYTTPVDSASAIGGIRSDPIGPGQRFVVATTEVCTRLLARDNEVTTRWIPVHHGIPGNEKADGYAKAAALGGNPEDAGLRRDR